LRNFISVNTTHWFINLVNGGDSDLPPCGAVDPTDPDSQVRCEIVPEMNTGDRLVVTGSVTNRTNDPWDADPIALQVDIDGNGQFLGQQETAYTQRPTKACASCDAEFEYNWSWFSQYGSERTACELISRIQRTTSQETVQLLQPQGLTST
jgi:hypothetical protein